MVKLDLKQIYYSDSRTQVKIVAEQKQAYQHDTLTLLAK